jgi:hypothetical protein
VDPGPGTRPVRRPIAVAEYLRDNDQFDRSITDFAKRYAERNELDHRAFAQAIRSGRLEAVEAGPHRWKLR